MTIDIQCKSRCVVAQRLLDGFDIVPALKGRYGIAVAQVMKPCIRVASFFDKLLEVEIDGLRGKVMAQFVSENQV